MGVFNAEPSTAQPVDSQRDPFSAAEQSAQVLPNLATNHELRTDGLDVAGAVRDARQALVDHQQQGVHGHVVDANVNAMTIGHTSAQLQTALEPLREAIYQSTLSDLGFSVDGAERPPEALRITARNLASLDVLCETFFTWIEERGVLTAKGKTRSAVNTLLSIIDRQTKLVAVIGLTRRSRDIGKMPIDEYLKHQQQQAGD